MQLVIQTGPKAGEQYELGVKPLVLGKDPASEITVPDTTMAERHARFENISGATFVADLESSNGTYLNGQRMSPGARYPLRPDDTLQIGSTLFKLQESVAVVAPAPVAVETLAQPALQPYQYTISTPYATPQPPVQAAAAAPTPAAPVQKKKRKIHWPSIIAALVVVIALNAAVIYYINTTSSASQQITTAGQATRAPTRATVGRAPTSTPEPNGGSNYKGPTPGIGGNIVPVTPVELGTGDVPDYPGARRIDSPNAGVFLTQFVTTDSFDKLSDWAKTAFASKGWTNVEIKNLPGQEGAVVTGVKGKMSLVTYLLGPGQKSTAPYDSFFTNASVEANGALVVINITVS